MGLRSAPSVKTSLPKLRPSSGQCLGQLMRSRDRLPPATSSQSSGTSPRRASSCGTSMPSGLCSSSGLQPASL
eukprot:4665316-Alexandrium_andersonii.AAC.1